MKTNLDETFSLDFAVLAIDGPPLEPRHLIRRLQHIVTVPARYRYERHSSGIVTLKRILNQVKIGVTTNFIQVYFLPIFLM